MRRVRTGAVLFVTLAAFAVPQATASPQLRAGEYIRFTASPSFPPGGKETGTLRILEVSEGRARFRLEVTMNPQAADDGFLTRTGVVEEGALKLSAGAAIYRSEQPEDKALGTCVLAFRRIHQFIVVAQSGKCWWFGEGVNASGKYRPAKTAEIHVVRQ